MTGIRVTLRSKDRKRILVEGTAMVSLHDLFQELQMPGNVHIDVVLDEPVQTTVQVRSEPAAPTARGKHKRGGRSS